MADLASVEDFLTGAEVDTAVFALRPDYRALLVAVDGLVPGPSDPTIEALLQAAETAAREASRDRPVEQLPAVAGWREAYRAFGAKPQRTRNSLQALLRRAATGLPRVNRLTDVYNAVSVLHQIRSRSVGRISPDTPARRGCCARPARSRSPRLPAAERWSSTRPR